MSYSIFGHLRKLYQKGRSPDAAEEYLLVEHNRRDFEFLRDHGYIENKHQAYLRLDTIPTGANLLNEIKLTPAGEFYVELRENLERFQAPLL
jgi:hypothetical protein